MFAKIRLKKGTYGPQFYNQIFEENWADISVQKNYGTCFLSTLGENNVCLNVLKIVSCITMQLIVSSHANFVIETLLYKNDFLEVLLNPYRLVTTNFISNKMKIHL